MVAEEIPFSLSSLDCCSYDKECSNPDDKLSFTVDVLIGDAMAVHATYL
jgi:hypothetical protein